MNEEYNESFEANLRDQSFNQLGRLNDKFETYLETLKEERNRNTRLQTEMNSQILVLKSQIDELEKQVYF